MTYDKQDLLLDLRRLAGEDDAEARHIEADDLLLKFIDDEHVTAAYEAIDPRWYS